MFRHIDFLTSPMFKSLSNNGCCWPNNSASKFPSTKSSGSLSDLEGAFFSRRQLRPTKGCGTGGREALHAQGQEVSTGQEAETSWQHQTFDANRHVLDGTCPTRTCVGATNHHRARVALLPVRGQRKDRKPTPPFASGRLQASPPRLCFPASQHGCCAAETPEKQAPSASVMPPMRRLLAITSDMFFWTAGCWQDFPHL